MQQLRFVRSTDEGAHVVVETLDGQQQFRLRVDPGLRDAVRADRPALRPPAADADPGQVGPREIQMRVRAGEAAEAIAAEYQIEVSRVLRFAGPVLEERARIASEARRARAQRAGDSQIVEFGPAVEQRFAAHGIEPAQVSWDSRRREDGQWVIVAAWRGGDRDRIAEWVLHLSTRTITPLDETAGDLLSDRPIRPVRAALPEPDQSSAPPLRPGVVAFPAMPDATTGPLPTRDDVFDQDAVDLDAPRRHAVPAGPLGGAAAVQPLGAEAEPEPEPVADRFEGFGYDEVVLPLDLPGEQPQERPLAKVRNLGQGVRRPRVEESDEERAARARIPSWDDILLGVRRKSD